MSKSYVIHVGHHAPEKVIIAYPNRNGDPKGEVFETHKQVGSYFIMNRARVWCRRVLPSGKLPVVDQVEQSLEVTDTRYKGNLEFLTWGDNKLGAQAIEIRFLTISSSIDYEYQRTVQKFDPRIEEDTMHIELAPGENKFDTDKEVLKIQFLKVHPRNRDSVSKDPDPKIKGSDYYEVSDEQMDKTFVRNREAALVTGIFVQQLSTKPQSLRNLLEIFKGYGVEFGSVNHLSNPTDIYAALLKFADIPGDFGAYVQRYKKELLDLFEYAKSFKALDLSKNGVIALLVNNKPEILLDKIEAKGDGMIDWVLENFADEADQL